ncbi:MAG: hypothetical protein FWE23_00715 [Chitinivibrionia bacterium]|nr:hypothetical protein [Chitinivibrionia bacterium]
MFSIVNTVLLILRYCVKHNINLVVDMRSDKGQFWDTSKISKENGWEYFFEQPFGFDLKQISNSKNILSLNEKKKKRPFSCISKYSFFDIYSIDKDFALFQEYKNDFKRYIKFSETAKNYLDSEYERIFKNNGRVLGVLARGTDYYLKKPKSHRVQPEPNLILETSEKVMRECNCDYVYLATEDDYIYTIFSEKFADKLLTNKQKRVDSRRLNLNENEFLANVNLDSGKYDLELTYLSSIYNLSKCECFVGGVTSGTTGVFLMKEGDFEYKHLFDLGYYS